MKKNKAMAKKFATELMIMNDALDGIEADEDAAQIVEEQKGVNLRLMDYLREIYTEEY